MKEAVLRLFPAHAHPLVLVSDPDDVLGEEEVLAELVARGLRIVKEGDPVRLRQRVEALRPWSARDPLLVITDGPTEKLPYDLWEQGHRTNLALHTFFPRLAYPVVKSLTPGQRARLSQAPGPGQTLGRKATIEYILKHAFDLDAERLAPPDLVGGRVNRGLARPGPFITWLAQLHRQGEVMPSVLREALVERLGALDAYREWPLEELLSDSAAFAAFVQREFERFAGSLAGAYVSEREEPYCLNFGRDPELQGSVPSLVLAGVLHPVKVHDVGELPPWARAAATNGSPEDLEAQLAAAVDALGQELALGNMRGRPIQRPCWEGWQDIARRWAEITIRRCALGALAPPDLVGGRVNRGLTPELGRRLSTLQAQMDSAFWGWLRERYAPLAAQQLPVPHHVYHLPHFMAYRRRQSGARERVALLVLDGMALSDWALIGSSWRKRHPGWHLEESLLLAQVPTITSVSRQALVSGLRPAEFMFKEGRSEAQGWRAFWAQQDLPETSVAYAHLAPDREEPPAVLSSSHPRALCLVDHTLDELTHGASLGAANVQAALRVWLESYSPRLEDEIAGLLSRGYVVYVASDHGHVEARGMGLPSEGLTVDTRGQRARLYTDRGAAERVRGAFAETELWERDGLLPEGVCALVPRDRLAFAAYHDTVVTHGGLTLEEVIVPLITIFEG